MEIFSTYKEIDRIERFLSNFAQEAILIIQNPDGTSIRIQPNCKIISAQPIYSEKEAEKI